jgi:Xaa-Pro aminopeptidase
MATETSALPAATTIPPRFKMLAIEQPEREERLRRVRAALEARGFAAIILFNPVRIDWLSGFSHVSTERPMAIVVPTDGDAGVLIPHLEQEHVAKSPLLKRIKVYPEYPGGGSGKHPLVHFGELLRELGLTGKGKTLACDTDGYGDLNGYLGPKLSEVVDGAAVVEAREIIDMPRQVKSPAELAFVRESAKWGNLAHRIMQERMAVGKTEIEVTLEATLEAVRAMLKTLGATYGTGGRGLRNPPCSCGFIAGHNTALPHGMRREGGLQPGDCIITGASANVGGYKSELERTMVVGEPTAEFRQYFDAMIVAQNAAFAALRPGRTCAEAEADVSRAIADQGYQALQRHHTGHGIGLEGHEQPFIDLDDRTVLAPGMVLSVEPGLYVPGLGGFRHSDTIIITDDGCELATYYPRDLDSLIVPA